MDLETEEPSIYVKAVLHVGPEVTDKRVDQSVLHSVEDGEIRTPACRPDPAWWPLSDH